MRAKEALRKKFERDHNSASWINADIYPNGRIFTQEYVYWLEQKLIDISKEAVNQPHYQKNPINP